MGGWWNSTTQHHKFFRPTRYSDHNHMRVNVEVIVRVDTNLKLDLVAGEESLLKDSEQPELKSESHFLRMEGLIKQAETTSFGNIGVINKAMLNWRPKDPVTDWTVTDLDDFLRG